MANKFICEKEDCGEITARKNSLFCKKHNKGQLDAPATREQLLGNIQMFLGIAKTCFPYYKENPVVREAQDYLKAEEENKKGKN